MAFVDLKTAIDLLRTNEVVALPTETVYGLAGRIDSETALKKIFETKKRPFFDPLIVHLSTDMSPLDYTTEWPAIYDLLTKRFWPGPLTLIAPKNAKISDLITSGLTEVALRSPDHSLIQKVISQLGVPLAAPSANLFGKTSPTQALHVETEFSGQVPVLDGGPCTVGLESTVVRFNSLKQRLEVLRPGLVSVEDLENFASLLSMKVVRAQSEVSPGHLKHHYQPKSPLVLIYKSDRSKKLPTNLIRDIQTQLSLPHLDPKILDLNGAPELIARRLYADLRTLSDSNQHLILAEMDVAKKTDPHWSMIFDRLEKASTIQHTL